MSTIISMKLRRRAGSSRVGQRKPVSVDLEQGSIRALLPVGHLVADVSDERLRDVFARLYDEADPRQHLAPRQVTMGNLRRQLELFSQLDGFRETFQGDFRIGGGILHAKRRSEQS